MGLADKFRNYKISKIIQEGKKKYEEKLLNVAIKEFEKVLKIEEFHFEANYYLADIYYKLRSHAKAREYFERMTISPQIDHRVYNTLGNTYRHLGLGSEAQSAYQKALEIDPNFEFAWLNLGATMADRRLFDEQVRHKIAYFLNNRTLVFSEIPMSHKYDVKTETIRDWANNIEYFSNILDKHPSYPDVKFLLSFSMIKTGHLDEAQKHLEALVEAKPDWAEAHLNLGAIYAAKGQLDVATQHLQESLKLKPHMSETRINMGHVYWKNGDKAHAVCMFLKSFDIEKQPTRNERTTEYLNEAIQCLKEKDFSTAHAELEHAIALSPRWADLYYFMGLAQEGLGNTIEAISYFKQSLSRNPQYSEATEKLSEYYDRFLQQAQQYENKNSYHDAIRSYETVLSIDNSHKQWYMKLYSLCNIIGNSAKAKIALDRYNALP